MSEILDFVDLHCSSLVILHIGVLAIRCRHLIAKWRQGTQLVLYRGNARKMLIQLESN